MTDLELVHQLILDELTVRNSSFLPEQSEYIESANAALAAIGRIAAKAGECQICQGTKQVSGPPYGAGESDQSQCPSCSGPSELETAARRVAEAWRNGSDKITIRLCLELDALAALVTEKK